MSKLDESMSNFTGHLNTTMPPGNKLQDTNYDLLSCKIENNSVLWSDAVNN